MPRRRPHPYAQRAAAGHSQDTLRSSSTGTGSKRVSFSKRLERGPSTPYSGRSTYVQPAGRAADVTYNENSSDEAETNDRSDDTESVDGPSQQVWNEELPESSKQNPLDYVYGSSRGFSRPVTETYEQQEASSLLKTLQKPLWLLSEAQQDELVCRRIHKLRAHIVEFAQAYVLSINPSKRPAEYLCNNVENAKLIRYIGFLAQGGVNGLDSWNELLSDHDCVHALVVGIVGMALKEHVFSALWFGGTPAQIKELEAAQEKQKDEDGESRDSSILNLSIESG
jgi:hypothetical protein